jgi:hypothetical protein
MTIASTIASVISDDQRNRSGATSGWVVAGVVAGP